MTLRHYQIFVAVCDTMNMTAAAEGLFMSQSAVSQAIAELEKYYDIRLFERLSRKLYLTQAGEKLLSYARHIISLNTEISKSMKSMHDTGCLRIGASVTVGSCVLPKLAAAYQASYPHITIEVIEDNTEQIERLLLTDKIDIGLVEGDVVSRDIVILPFMKDDLVLICGKDHPFAGRVSVNPQELEKEKFIIREKGSGTRKTFENEMANHEVSWNALWTCNNADTIKAAVAEGLGVSVISGRAIQTEVELHTLFAIPVNGMTFKRTFKILHHKNKYITEPLRTFMALCKTEQPESL